MIPQRLTIKGIYSYQQEQTIDFEYMMDSQLFGIFGPVGSGKSTILEAITFALYGESERLHQRDNRGYNMMNLKSDELLIDFIFEASDEKLYRFTVNGKRNRKHFEKVATFERAAYRQEWDGWKPIETGSATSIIGLSYQNFRRTIIIPQGKFQEFLFLGDKDRTQMMKDIFQLHRFDLFYKTNMLAARTLAEREHLSGQLTKYEEVSEERIREDQEKLTTIESRLGTLQKKYEQLTKEEEALKGLREKFQALSDLREQLSAMMAEGSSIADLTNQVKTYEYCLIHFKSELDKYEAYRRQQAEQEQELRAKKEKSATLTRELEEAEAAFLPVKHRYDDRAQVKSALEELKLIIRIKEAGIARQALEERLKKGKQVVDERLKALQTKETEAQQLAHSLAANRAALPDLGQIAEVKAWFGKKNYLSTDLEKLRQKITIEEEQTRELTRQVKALIPAGLPDKAIDSAPDAINLLESAGKVLEEKIAALDEDNQALKLHEELEQWVQQVKDGKPCPLCGSDSHPAILELKDVDREREKIARMQSAIKKELDSLAENLKQLNGIKIRQEDLQQQRQSDRKSLEAMEQAYDKHLKDFRWENFDPQDEKSANTRIADAAALQKSTEQQQQTQEQLTGTLARLKKEWESARSLLEKLEQERSGLDAEQNTLASQLQQLGLADYDNRTIADLEAEVYRQSEELTGLEETYLRMEKNIRESQQQKNVLQGQLEESQQNFHQVERQFQQLQQDLDTKVQGSELKDLKAIRSVLATNLDLQASRQTIEDYNRQLHTLRENKLQLERSLKGQTFDQKRYDLLSEELAALKQDITTLQETFVREQTLLTKMQEELTLKKELELKLAEVRERSENLDTLKQLFKGSGFVNYISSIFLQNLCHAANERFYKLTRQKLRLELAANNSFQVRDYLNEGQVRSVKTLSGGQAFQAGLSLALALADHIQQQHQARQNFFFLDEGFGSQDRESLQTVFETLKSLRRENRIVGIISHVEELQQEIDVYLDIRNDDETGSQVRPNWE